MLTDASVAKGMASRRGTGKVRHMEVATVWAHEKARTVDIRLTKVSGAIKIVDAMTNRAAREVLDERVKESGTMSMVGTRDLALQS